MMYRSKMDLTRKFISQKVMSNHVSLKKIRCHIHQHIFELKFMVKNLELSLKYSNYLEIKQLGQNF